MAVSVILNGTTYPNVNHIKVPTSDGNVAIFDVRGDVQIPEALYPLEDGSHVFSNGTIITVTNGNHVVVNMAERRNANAPINISNIFENTSDAYATGEPSNVANKSTKFIIPSGATVIFGIYNLVEPTGNGTPAMFNIFGKTANVGMAITSVNQCYALAKKFDEDTEIGCLFTSLTKAGITEFDVALIVNGTRYV